VFLLNREAPIYSLQHLILSFGGTYYIQDDIEANPNLKYTHHVIDRLQVAKKANIEYV